MKERTSARKPKRRKPGAKKIASKRRGAHLGQHFLTAQWAARTLAEAVRIEPGDTVLEIGPGTGNLTKELLREGAQVIAVEKDTALITTLSARFAEEIARGQLTVVSSDIREFDAEQFGLTAGEYVLAANIPYYITGEIIRTFLTAREYPARVALLIQKEVAERIARSKKESVLSLSVKAFGEAKYVKTVSRGCFSPPPSVDSAILLIDKISHASFKSVREERFFEIIKAAFSQKRKMLGNSLQGVVDETTLERAGLDPKTRPETVTLKEWLRLAKIAK